MTHEEELIVCQNARDFAIAERDAAVARSIQLQAELAETLPDRIAVADWFHLVMDKVNEAEIKQTERLLYVRQTQTTSKIKAKLTLDEHEEKLLQFVEQVRDVIRDVRGWTGTEGMPPSNYVDRNAAEKRLAAMTAERDEAREKSLGHAQRCNNYKDDLFAERARAEKAEAACAAMRAALELLLAHEPMLVELQIISTALATDVGAGWVSPERARAVAVESLDLQSEVARLETLIGDMAREMRAMVSPKEHARVVAERDANAHYLASANKLHQLRQDDALDVEADLDAERAHADMLDAAVVRASGALYGAVRSGLPPSRAKEEKDAAHTAHIVHVKRRGGA